MLTNEEQLTEMQVIDLVLQVVFYLNVVVSCICINKDVLADHVNIVMCV